MKLPFAKPQKKKPARRAWNSTAPQSTKPLPRSTKAIARTPVKKKSRSKAEKVRIYGPDERIAWLKGQPCAACRVVGYSEVAHAKSGGMGRKDDAAGTLPLCGPHVENPRLQSVEGCHRFLHRVGRRTFESFTNCHLETAAAKTELNWRKFQAGSR